MEACVCWRRQISIANVHTPFTYKQEWLNSGFECEQNRCDSIQKMDLRDKNIVEIIAKVIEEGETVNGTYCCSLFIYVFL